MSLFAEAMLDFELEPAQARLVDGDLFLTEKGMLQTTMRGVIKDRFNDVPEYMQMHAADSVACAQYHLRDLGEAVKYLHTSQPDTPIHLVHCLVDAAEKLEYMRLLDNGFTADEIGVDEAGTLLYVKVDEGENNGDSN